ncbi:MAG: sulfatase [Planctomycetes bacterium]|nr:sulfatase [Planctomycetota bacterium]
MRHIADIPADIPAVIAAVTILAAALPGAADGQQARPPSFVILLADDLGYGDLGCYGHPTIRTPSLDRMAAEGARFTQFYCAAPVCTPSRAALLTGRLPVRSGMCSEKRRVLFPDSADGLPDDEVTLAEALKTKGYATACIGKWHLGHLPRFLPARHGFDRYFGLPYSNDMHNVGRGDPPVPLLRGDEVIEQPARQEALTSRYTEEALRFIGENRDRPFFLYVAYTFPHVPLHASARFNGKSPRGLYGDVVEELDASVGEILGALREPGLAGRTLVVFSSDNGPWLTQGLAGGSAGLLREGKGSTWEGGMRVPGIAWWPGKVSAGRLITNVVSSLDVFPTFLTLAGIEPPRDRAIDGREVSALLLGTAAPPEAPFFYYRDETLMAVRKGPWKAHVLTRPGYGAAEPKRHDPPLLFQLERDPSEVHDVAKQHPEVVRDLLGEVERHRAGLRAPPSRLEARTART